MQLFLLLQPSSAAVERAFSLLKASFGEQQDSALQDYVEASLLLQFNKRLHCVITKFVVADFQFEPYSIVLLHQLSNIHTNLPRAHL